MTGPRLSITRRSGLALLAGLPAGAGAEPVLRIATGDYPPYADAQRADGGLVTARLRAAFAQQGIGTQFEFMPWARALEQTRRGAFDASSYWWSDDELPRDFLLSRPVVSNALRWLRRRDRPLRAADTVALVLGYNYPRGVQAALQRLGLRTQTVHNDLAGLRMVLRGRAQAIPVDEGNACVLLNSVEPGERQLLALSPAGEPLDQRDGVLLLPRVLAQSARYLALCNEGLRATLPAAELGRGMGCRALPLV